MRNLTEIAKNELLRDMPSDGVFVDLVLGSGFDSLELAKVCTKGIIYSFGKGSDIDTACKLFESAERDNIRLINDTPDNMNIYIDSPINCIIARASSEDLLLGEVLSKALRIAINKLVPGGKALLITTNEWKPLTNLIASLPYREFFTMSFTAPNDNSSLVAIVAEKR